LRADKLSSMLLPVAVCLTLLQLPAASAELLQDVRFVQPRQSATSGPPADRLVFELPALEQAPVIDGKLDDEAWSLPEARLGKFRLGLSATPARHTREAWAAYDSSNLYFGIRLQREPGVPLRVNTTEPDDGKIWEDDEAELFVDPFTSGSAYYQMIVNSAAVLYDAAHRNVEVPDPRSDSPGDMMLERVSELPWSSGLMRAVHVEDEWWSIEMALPMASLGLEGAPAGHRIGFNLTSADWDTNEYTCLSPTSDWHDPLQFGVLVLGKPRIEVTGLDLSGIGSGRNLLEVDASHLQGPEGQYQLALTFAAPAQWLRKVVLFDLAHDRSARAGLPFSCSAEEGPWEAQIEIADPDGRAVYATRRVGNLPGAMQVRLRSSAVLRDALPVEVSVRLGVGRLTARRMELSARLLDERGSTVAQQQIGVAGGPNLRALVPVNDLQPGTYVLELLASLEGEVVASGRDLLRVAASPFEDEAR
jgi:hypothetical protein